MIFKIRDMHTDSFYVFKSNNVEINKRKSKINPNRKQIIITVNDSNNKCLQSLLESHEHIRPIFFIDSIAHRRNFEVILYRDSVFKDSLMFRGSDAINFMNYIIDDQFLYHISEINATVYNWNYEGKQSKYMMIVDTIYICPI